MRKSFLTILLLGFGPAALALDTAHHLTLEQWAVPRSAGAVVSMPALSRTLQDFQATPNPSLRIHHPGGESGSLWAAELRSWLIALGVPSTDLEMRPGSANIDVIQLEIVSGGQKAAPVMTIFPEESVENP